MSESVKIIGNEIALNSATGNTVDLATYVRLMNANTTTNFLITHEIDGVNAASFTLGYAGSDGSVIYMMKKSTDEIFAEANDEIKAVKVAFY